jgi:hypothetical protein
MNGNILQHYHYKLVRPVYKLVEQLKFKRATHLLFKERNRPCLALHSLKF